MDPAWDAAIQRAGLLRVQDTHELFSAVETLSHMRPLRGDRLMIISTVLRLPRWRWMPYGHAMASWQR
ncbi:putative acyl-CoA synthetase [Escherichia coli]|uniref:Putative acyl-CoA synthetase n=1 Tax=Escherichia coli TaxID=562 RepID=A0A485JCX6_ECOLX|nr:putative acyl-CoA synthetase [Escherichia coli]